ncbi:cytochrome P450 [Mycena floridula]|nr:cytochrome P450 [Mycena floridula]
MAYTWPSSLLLFLFLPCICAYFTLRKPAATLPLPPGPKRLWSSKTVLPGNSRYPWITYAREWKELYGDLIYIHVLGNPIIILNSATCVSDLLEKRSANYSSRPTRTMVVDLIGWDWLFSSMVYGTFWKRHRSLFNKHFPTGGSSVYRQVQQKEIHTLLRRLLDKPDSFRAHVRRAAASIILNITYGISIDEEVDENGDNYVTLADKALTSLSKAGIFGTYLVDYLPWLKHAPAWLPFRRQASIWRNTVREMVDRPFEMVQTKMKQGTAVSSIVAQELENISSGLPAETVEVIKNMAATTYAAGSDTTVSAILSLFLAMALHPEVQDKAQRELDSVLEGRLPVHDDRAQLPYIQCICLELLRWQPVTPLGLAHFVTEDDEYRGYRLPKGSTVLANVWGILHDPEVYPDPLVFNPDRFEDAEKNAREGLNENPDAAFGFSRRSCPGKVFASDMLWIAAAQILSVFRITKAKDERGQIIEPDIDYTSQLLSHPNPFRCSVTPRSREAEALVLQTMLEDL